MLFSLPWVFCIWTWMNKIVKDEISRLRLVLQKIFNCWCWSFLIFCIMLFFYATHSLTLEFTFILGSWCGRSFFVVQSVHGIKDHNVVIGCTGYQIWEQTRTEDWRENSSYKVLRVMVEEESRPMQSYRLLSYLFIVRLHFIFLLLIYARIE